MTRGRWPAALAFALVAMLVGLPSPPSATVLTDAADSWADASTASAVDRVPQGIRPATPMSRRAPTQVDGLEADATVTYRLEPNNELIRVTHTIELRNTKPPRNVPGGQEIFFFDRFAVFLLGVPDGLSVSTVAGGSLNTSVEELGDDARVLDIDLSPNLNFGSPQTLTVTYNLRSQPSGSATSVRVNEAYATWFAIGAGTDGRNTIIVDVPERFETEIASDAASDVNESDGRVRYRFEGLTLDAAYFGVSSTDAERLVTRSVDIEDDNFEINAWPGDEEWGEFAERSVRDGIPALSDALGLDLEGEREIVIAETATPGIYGYGGWVVQDTVEISDERDALLMLHELSHLWLNNDLFNSRWVTEGLAEHFANETAGALDGTGVAPEAPDRSAGAALALNRWATTRLLDTDPATERYGYGAAYWLVRKVARLIGDDRLQEVLQRAQADELPFSVEGDATVALVTDWRYFYDLVELSIDDEADVDTLDTLFRNHVLAGGQVDQLTRRHQVHDDYTEFDSTLDDWEAPLVLRQALARWEFDRVGRLFDVAGTVTEARADYEARAGDALSLPDGFGDRFASASNGDDLRDLAADLDEAAEFAPRLGRALDRVDGFNPLYRSGLAGSDAADQVRAAERAFSAGDVEDAEEALAAAQDRLDDAAMIGLIRIVALGAIIGAVALHVQARRRRRANAAPHEGGR